MLWTIWLSILELAFPQNSDLSYAPNNLEFTFNFSFFVLSAYFVIGIVDSSTWTCPVFSTLSAIPLVPHHYINTYCSTLFEPSVQNVLWTTEPPWRTPFLLYSLFLLVHRSPLFTPQAFISPKLYRGFTCSRNHPHMPNRSCVHLFSTCLYHCPGRYFHDWIQYNFMCLFFTYVMISSSYSKNNLRSLT